MATKINTAYYGAENTFIEPISGVTAVKGCAKTTGELARAGTYTGGSFDLSAAPWGIGRSSVSSDFIWLPLRVGDSSPYTWQLNAYQNEKTNTPLYIYHNPNTVLGGNDPSDLDTLTVDISYCRGIFKMRSSPNISIDSSFNAKSTLSIDNNTTVSTSVNAQKMRPITYLDYQDIRLCINDIYYKPTGSTAISKCSMSDIINHIVSVDKIVRVEWNFRAYNYGSGTNLQLSIGGSELDIPDKFRSVYYGDSLEKWVRPWHRISGVGYWYRSGSSLSFSTFNSSRITAASRYDTQTALNDVVSSGNCGYGHLSAHMQVFDDVSYHWEYGVSPEGNNQWDLDPYADGSAFSWETQVRFFAYMELDGDVQDKNIAYYRAILHEAAFLGLPIITGSGDNDKLIGSGAVFLPIFSDAMITTGQYMSGIDSLNLPNAAWHDIFGTTMPDYDPSFDPEPEPEEGDSGDLTNRIPNRFAVGGLGLYVTNYQTLYSLQQFLNGTYAPTAEALAADFKGTNPQDYIISVQKYPSDALLPTSANQSDILIGKIDSTFDAYTLNDPQGSALGHYSFGQLTVGSDRIPIFGDFRDYQSKITLLMPFVGTAELDPRLYVGHSIGLDYVIDYLTGSVAAEIKRDGLTVETKTSKLSITVPFLAGNMGQYQNQLAQLEMSIEQSKIKQISGAVTTLFGVGGAAATVAGGGSELAGLGSGAGIIRGASNLLLERINQESLEYQVEHTQPSVGTISTASPGNAFEMDDRARLLIWRPYMLAGYDEAIYAHVVGHATLRAAQLSSFSGLTVAASAELSGIYTIDGTKAATEQELQMIKRALLAGVYV